MCILLLKIQNSAPAHMARINQPMNKNAACFALSISRPPVPHKCSTQLQGQIDHDLLSIWAFWSALSLMVMGHL